MLLHTKRRSSTSIILFFNITIILPNHSPCTYSGSKIYQFKIFPAKNYLRKVKELILFYSTQSESSKTLPDFAISLEFVAQYWYITAKGELIELQLVVLLMWLAFTPNNIIVSISQALQFTACNKYLSVVVSSMIFLLCDKPAILASSKAILERPPGQNPMKYFERVTLIQIINHQDINKWPCFQTGSKNNFELSNIIAIIKCAGVGKDISLKNTQH